MAIQSFIQIQATVQLYNLHQTPLLVLLMIQPQLRTQLFELLGLKVYQMEVQKLLIIQFIFSRAQKTLFL